MKRYEAIAAEIGRSIENGALRPNERLPSVRQSSALHGVSPSTIFQAYDLLEARGLVLSRPRSGYYVRERRPRTLPEAETAAIAHGGSKPVDVSELVFQVLQSSSTRDVIPLGSAFPSPLLFPRRHLARAMTHAVQQLDPWAAVDDLSAGNMALRRQIALRYLMHGVRVQAEEIVITNGALEALTLSLAAVTEPGDAVIVEAPTFYGALQALERLRLRAVEVPLHPRNGIDLGALEQALHRHRPKAAWLMTHYQNPLGCSLDEGKARALVDLLAGHGVPLIEDDVYGDLHFGSQRPKPAKAFDRHGLVMHCSSFSKSLAPGFRIGWAMPGRYAQAVARQKLTTSLATSSPGQAALAHYLEKRHFDRYLGELRRQLATQQTHCLHAVADHFPAGTRATRPDGGYFIWLELPHGTDALQIQRDASNLGISVAPGPIFSASRAFGHCLRLNTGHPWSPAIESAIATLGRLAKPGPHSAR